MKRFIILTFVCLIGSTLAQLTRLSDEEKAKLQADLEDCVKEGNVSDEDAEKLKKFEFENPSDSLKCVSACYLEKLGALKDNQVQEETITEKLLPLIGEDKTAELLKLCKDVQGEERCETGFKLFECVWNYKAF